MFGAGNVTPSETRWSKFYNTLVDEAKVDCKALKCKFSLYMIKTIFMLLQDSFFSCVLSTNENINNKTNSVFGNMIITSPSCTQQVHKTCLHETPNLLKPVTWKVRIYGK
jgi:hypothetical protein